MTRTPLLVLLCCGFGCSGSASERPPSDTPPELEASTNPDIAAFWSWFAANSESLSKEVPPSKAILNELGARLTKVASGLQWMLAFEEPPTFGVTARGKKELFAIVRALIRAAPKLPNWKFYAFKPRSEHALPCKTSLGDYTLDSDEMSFSAEKVANHQVLLTLFVRKPPTAELPYIEKTCHDLLEDLLGEVDLATKVRSFQVESLPEGPESRRLRPLKELPGIVDEWTK